MELYPDSRNMRNPDNTAPTAGRDRDHSGAMKKRSVVIAGHRTSVSLENAFWDALKSIASHRSLTVNQLVTEIDRQRQGNLSSAIRVFVLLFFKADGAGNGRDGQALAP